MHRSPLQASKAKRLRKLPVPSNFARVGTELAQTKLSSFQAQKNSLAFSLVTKGNAFLPCNQCLRDLFPALSFILDLTIDKYIWRGFCSYSCLTYSYIPQTLSLVPVATAFLFIFCIFSPLPCFVFFCCNFQNWPRVRLVSFLFQQYHG